MKLNKAFLFATAPLLILAACSEPAPGNKAATTTVATTQAAATTTALPAPAVDPQPLDVPALADASSTPVGQAINAATWTATPASPTAKRDALIRAETLLDRAHFAPGVIDGQGGGNLKNAISAYEAANNLPVDGQMDDQVWALLAKDSAPVVVDYVITDDDVKGPFLAKIPTDEKEMAKLPALSYTSVVEELGERFHMDEALLKALNPGTDFNVAGARIVVVAPSTGKLSAKVTRIEVDKTKHQVRAYGADKALLATYPATVGSVERPAPSGEWAVRTLAPAPTYTFDPSRLTFGKASNGKLTIAAGPNNPVGSTWIDLTKDTYGIHGTPDPRLVGKVASHGCVRLTNWDAHQLGQAVQKGTAVVFMGADPPAKKS